MQSDDVRLDERERKLLIHLSSLAVMRRWDQCTIRSYLEYVSFMTCCKVNCDAIFSDTFPWEIVKPLQYQDFDFASTAPEQQQERNFLAWIFQI